jgi:hypothetical protein
MEELSAKFLEWGRSARVRSDKYAEIGYLSQTALESSLALIFSLAQ